MTRETPRAYRSDRREAQARETRRRVLAGATTTFLRRGYAGASMRTIASAADVSVATVELVFGTKAAVLKAAIDVAIAGDDEQVPVLDREWVARAEQLADVDAFFALAAAVITPAQQRSAGLVLAVLEAAPLDVDLARLSAQLIRQRLRTAEWVVATLATKTVLRPELSVAEAADTLWMLMDPAVFDRLVRHRGWSLEQYQTWFAESARRLLVPDPRHDQPSPT